MHHFAHFCPGGVIVVCALRDDSSSVTGVVGDQRFLFCGLQPAQARVAGHRGCVLLYLEFGLFRSVGEGGLIKKDVI